VWVDEAQSVTNDSNLTIEGKKPVQLKTRPEQWLVSTEENK